MIGVVLAGGGSRRFQGEPKGLMRIAGTSMAMRVHRVLSEVCSGVFIEALPNAGYESLQTDCIYAASDDQGKGPLAGIAAGLGVAAEDEFVAFAPCDMPLLSASIYRRLRAEPEGGYAVSDAGIEPLVCVLPSRLLPDVRAALGLARVPGVKSFLEGCGAVPVPFHDAALFANVNSAEDLSRVIALLSK